MHNNTILDVIQIRAKGDSPSSWMCNYHRARFDHDYQPDNFIPNSNDPGSNETIQWFPWRVRLTTGEEVEVSRCRSEKTKEQCKVQFSLGIMITVIICNFVKACSMVLTVVRSREPTLVTLGNAVDSFLRSPDPTTPEMCFADRRFFEREWGHGWRTGPRQWKQKGVLRWRTSVSKTRWITCNFFSWIIIIIAGVLLEVGMSHGGRYLRTDIKSIWIRGFGEVNSVSRVSLHSASITQAILLANIPKTILSFLYLTYNSLFTCKLAGYEWSLLGNHHRTPRVTSLHPGQRSTYWLQVPYIYAIPLMTLSGLLHWLTSQSLFLDRVEISDPLGNPTSSTINTVGYSCTAIIFVLTLGILALLTAAGMGCKPSPAVITAASSCPAPISAACHTGGVDLEGITGRKVRWGEVGILPHLGVRHLTFSDKEDVKKPEFGGANPGMGRG